MFVGVYTSLDSVKLTELSVKWKAVSFDVEISHTHWVLVWRIIITYDLSMGINHRIIFLSAIIIIIIIRFDMIYYAGVFFIFSSLTFNSVWAADKNSKFESWLFALHWHTLASFVMSINNNDDNADGADHDDDVDDDVALRMCISLPRYRIVLMATPVVCNICSWETLILSYFVFYAELAVRSLVCFHGMFEATSACRDSRAFIQKLTCGGGGMKLRPKEPKSPKGR